jgi:hypothetical protein
MTIAHTQTMNAYTRDDNDVADAKHGEDGGQATSMETRKHCENGGKCGQDKTKTVGTSQMLRAVKDGKVLVHAFVILPTPPLMIQGPSPFLTRLCQLTTTLPNR